MPRWLAIVTYLLALTLLIVVSRSLWITLVFPAWVCAISVFILTQNSAAHRDARTTR
jgi:hypothetical protein